MTNIEACIENIMFIYTAKTLPNIEEFKMNGVGKSQWYNKTHIIIL